MFHWHEAIHFKRRRTFLSSSPSPLHNLITWSFNNSCHEQEVEERTRNLHDLLTAFIHSSLCLIPRPKHQKANESVITVLQYRVGVRFSFLFSLVSICLSSTLRLRRNWKFFFHWGHPRSEMELEASCSSVDEYQLGKTCLPFLRRETFLSRGEISQMMPSRVNANWNELKKSKKPLTSNSALD